MEFKKIELDKKERQIVNNVLLENCMGLSDVFREQTTDEGRNKIGQIIQVCVSSQQLFFEKAQDEEIELPESMLEFLKPLIEGNFEHLKSVQSQMIKNGDKEGWRMGEMLETMLRVIKKIPDPSLIQRV